MSVQKLAEDYFSKMNSMASRLCADVNETRATYDKLWPTLTSEEQDQILNESIIRPEISLKYNNKNYGNTQYTKQYAVKLIVDENCSYRDEHSSPFTFRTPSQRDLRLFQDDIKANSKGNNFGVTKKTENSNDSCNIELLKESAETGILPKTGLDLLDNW